MVDKHILGSGRRSFLFNSGDNTVGLMFVKIAEGLGIRSISHTDYRSTSAKLALLGLENVEEFNYVAKARIQDS